MFQMDIYGESKEYSLKHMNFWGERMFLILAYESATAQKESLKGMYRKQEAIPIPVSHLRLKVEQRSSQHHRR